MDISLLAKGLLVGLCVAVPIGPMGAVCIRRALNRGSLSGIFSALGVSLADTIYGFIAVLGLTVISDWIVSEQFWLRFVGAILLLGYGVKIFFTRSTDSPAVGRSFEGPRRRYFLSDFSSTFFLTLLNPFLFFFFAALFAVLGVHVEDNSRSLWSSFLLTIGVFIGSSLWGVVLAVLVFFFRKKISQSMLRWMNPLVGILVFSFAIGILFFLF